MLNGQYFTPDYCINPIDGGTVKPASLGATANPGKVLSTVGTEMSFSYAMLKIEADGGGDAGRRREWKESINSSAAVISDRNEATSATDAESPWNDELSGDWTGTVTMNDGSATFVTFQEAGQSKAIVENTRYGGGATVLEDNLFDDTTVGSTGATPDANAFMVFHDDSAGTGQKVD
jgi:hypothetical protein